MSGSWIVDSTLVILHLKLRFRSTTRRIDLPPVSHRFTAAAAAAIAVSWQISQSRVQCYCVSTSLINIGLTIADS